MNIINKWLGNHLLPKLGNKLHTYQTLSKIIKVPFNNSIPQSLPRTLPTFLFFGKLFSLVPNFSGIEEVGCNLNIAGCHLVDLLGNGHWRATSWSTTAPRRIISRIAWRQLWRNRGRHPNGFATHRETGSLLIWTKWELCNPCTIGSSYTRAFKI